MAGWNRPQEGVKPPVKKSGPGAMRGLVAGVAVVVIGIAVWLFVGGGADEKGGAAREGRKIRDAAGEAAKGTRIKDVPAEQVAKPSARQQAEKAEEQPAPEDAAKKKEPGELFSTQTNAIGLIIERYRLPNGKTYRKERPLPSVLTTASDQLLAMATADGLGSAPPIPVGDGMDEDDNFGEALKKPIEIKPDDSPEVKALKERVKAAREAMLAEMAKGATFSEVIKAEQQMARDNEKTLNEVQSAINECLKKNDAEGAKAIYDKFGSTLEQMGIEGLTLEPDPEDLADDDEQPVKEN